MGINGSREIVSDVASGEGGGGVGGGVNFFDGLPEGFIADTLSRTSPRDVCRMSVVSSILRSAAEWDIVWEKFLPVDYRDIISQAVDSDRLNRLNKKKLYLYLCDNPILIDGGNKSFSLEKNSGKKCYMLAAKDLGIAWGATPEYWRWKKLRQSRFSEVAELIKVDWFEIRGMIDTNMLSHNTVYLVYLVFKTTAKTYGFDHPAALGYISVCGEVKNTRKVYLDPAREQNQLDRGLIENIPQRLRGAIYPSLEIEIQNQIDRELVEDEMRPQRGLNGVYPEERRDGWLETEIGYYFNKDGGDGELEMTLTDIEGGDDNWKGGLIIEGIEIRPKAGKMLKTTPALPASFYSKSPLQKFKSILVPGFVLSYPLFLLYKVR